MKSKVLFLCTGNSCRSQMAEGWARHLHAKSIDAYSAGTNPAPINPLAIKVMREVGVDISHQHSKHVDSQQSMIFDLIVTVCDNAAASCPTAPGHRITHVPFEDPPKLATTSKNEDEALNHYRKIRDEIREFIMTLPALLDGPVKDKSSGGF